MAWVFGRFHFDFLAFISPALAVFALSSFIPIGESSAYLAFAFLITGVIDAGHAYTSGWRAFRARADNPKRGLFVWSLPAIVAVCFGWLIAGLPGFWTFVLYFTVYHHIRQFYGYTRWYQALNRRSCPWSGRFLYALTLLPLAAFHVRGDWDFHVYQSGDFLRWPSTMALQAFAAAWMTCLFAWAVFEARLLWRGLFEPNRALSIAVPAILHGYCFFVGKSIVEVLFPLLAVHGVSYMAVTARSVRKLRRESSVRAGLRAGIAVLVTALLAGIWELAIDEHGFVGAPWTSALVSAVLVTPNLWHYLVDGFIWKRDDPGARLIYSADGASL